MKRVLVLLAGIMLCSNAFTQNSADYKAFIKERKAVQKMVKEERNEKVSKDARKEAKAYAKEGWKAPAGALPLEKQLEKLYQMLFEYDLENGMPKYVKGGGRAISTSYDAAKMQAMAHARTDLAGNIQTEVVGIINDKNVTKELGKGDAVAFNESVQASKQFITQSIGRVITVVERYRELSNKNYEVEIIIAYNGEMAAQAAKKAIKEDLEKKGEKLSAEIDKLLGF